MGESLDNSFRDALGETFLGFGDALGDFPLEISSYYMYYQIIIIISIFLKANNWRPFLFMLLKLYENIIKMWFTVYHFIATVQASM